MQWPVRESPDKQPTIREQAACLFRILTAQRPIKLPIQDTVVNF